jgi:predicted metal-dependent hydrolase
VSSELRFEAAGRSAVLQLKASRQARVMRLRVDQRTGAVVLTIPARASKRKALEWADGQRAWVEQALAKVEQPERIGPGSVVPLYGNPHLVEWSPDLPRRVRLEEGRIVAGGPADGLHGRILRWLRGHAEQILAAETREFAGEAGVEVTRVAVGDPLSRWGSCSTSGSIRYSWRLILAPDGVRRATVAHEVAHRVHMNHGPDFHALVESLLEADPAPARLWLRRNGASLHRIARG